MSLYGGVSSLVEMRGAVKDLKPNASNDFLERAINRRIRSVCLKRTWSDLTKFVTYPLPNATNTGTVSTVTGSNIITGSGTGWPVSDTITTTVVLPVRQLGVQKITPASMAGIRPGSWLYVDAAGTAPFGPEAVAVIEVRGDSFWANMTKTHDQNFTITQSSLAGQQFRTTYPFYTVTAVVSATELLLDQLWGDVSATGLQYQIMQVYIQPDPYCWRIKQAWDPIQGEPLNVDDFTFEEIIIGDPQMTASEDPNLLVPVPPGGGGVAQWFVYPPQASARPIIMVISTIWPRLIADQDRAPSFINPDVFVLGAIADALRTKTVTQGMPKDPYYDPQVAMTYEAQFKEQLNEAEEADQARLPDRLRSYEIRAMGLMSTQFWQRHPGWPTQYAG